MNKRKVTNLVNSISYNSYQAGWSHAYDTGNDDNFKWLEDELNSKPVMPKVFDKWYKGSSYNDPDTPKFKIIHFTTMAMFGGKGIQKDEQLCKWIMKDKHGDKYAYDEKRFIRCMEAIIHGYEVEK